MLAEGLETRNLSGSSMEEMRKWVGVKDPFQELWGALLPWVVWLSCACLDRSLSSNH